jgi:hypothetical protein
MITHSYSKTLRVDDLDPRLVSQTIDVLDGSICTLLVPELQQVSVLL